MGQDLGVRSDPLVRNKEDTGDWGSGGQQIYKNPQ